MLAIRAVQVSKIYKIFERPFDFLLEKIDGRSRHRPFQALNEVSIDISHGKCIGLLGRNGAGKSTFLKIIARTLSPTSGHVDIEGRISAILELGTGFNPQYSGYDNIVLGGLSLGMSRDEIVKKVDSIVDFSGLREVIHQPFRTYSSGMQSRLTFSTAISIDPEILIVDEALATGDIAFVEKCLNRIEEIVRSGSTVLLVSHNPNLITRFADRAVWLDSGKVIMDEDAETVSQSYQARMYQPSDSSVSASIGDQQIVVSDLNFVGESTDGETFKLGKPFALEISVHSKIKSETMNIGLQICRGDGQVVWTATNNIHLDSQFLRKKEKIAILPGNSVFKISLGPLNLNPGRYYVNIGIEPYPDPATVQQYHHWAPRFRKFRVIREDRGATNAAIDFPSKWTLLESEILS